MTARNVHVRCADVDLDVWCRDIPHRRPVLVAHGRRLRDSRRDLKAVLLRQLLEAR